MHPSGFPLLGGTLVATALVGLLEWELLIPGLLLALALAFFFRHPTRVASANGDAVISPADGIVQEIDRQTLPPEITYLEHNCSRVSIVLSLFDVHVNRAPIGGRVIRIVRCRGTFLRAASPHAASQNEQVSVLFEGAGGRRIAVIQIAGFVARRIVCDLNEGQMVAVSQSYGLIKFGSRVDMYFPDDANILVEKGQRVRGGETSICMLRTKI